MNYLENPVFICGHRKGGTTMLINLFDGSSDAIVYPDDSGLFYMYYPKYAKEEFSDSEKINRLANRVGDENLKEIIDDINCMDTDKEILLRKQRSFHNKLLKYNEIGFETKDILKYFIDSFQKSFFEKAIEPKVWIEKTTSTEIYAVEIAKWFKNAKFIHIVRDPRDNWASLKSGWEKRYTNYNDSINELMHSMIERGHLGLRMAKENQEILGVDKYSIIKYEDLTMNSEHHMRSLANFIGIEFNENLLNPTKFGFSWNGNNFDGIKNTKPSSINVNRWKKRITDEEAALIEYYFEDVMCDFGYELSYSKIKRQSAARNHYKWYNFSTKNSVN